MHTICSIALYKDKKEWKKLVKNAMKADFSWAKSAVEYNNIYKELIK